MFFIFIRLSKEFYFREGIYRNLKLCNINFDLVSHTSENPSYSGGNVFRAMHSQARVQQVAAKSRSLVFLTTGHLKNVNTSLWSQTHFNLFPKIIFSLSWKPINNKATFQIISWKILMLYFLLCILFIHVPIYPFIHDPPLVHLSAHPLINPSIHWAIPLSDF